MRMRLLAGSVERPPRRSTRIGAAVQASRVGLEQNRVDVPTPVPSVNVVRMSARAADGRLLGGGAEGSGRKRKRAGSE